MFGKSKKKSQYIANQVRDGVATPQETSIFAELAIDPQFVAHEAEIDNAMAFLRSEKIEPQLSKDFNGRLIRRWRVEARKRTFAYWSPVVAGGFVAAACLLTVLQLLMNTPEIQKVNLGGQEAKLDKTNSPEFSSFKDIPLRQR